MAKNRFWKTAVILNLFMVLGYLAFTSRPVVNAALPPRPSPEPTATAVSVTATPPEETAVSGAQIRLEVSETMRGSWTAVQWQDRQGTWHDVTGWQGELDNHGLSKTWWVGPENFGQGPFRWQVYDQIGGDLIAESEFFNLPEVDRQVMVIQLKGQIPD